MDRLRKGRMSFIFGGRSTTRLSEIYRTENTRETELDPKSGRKSDDNRGTGGIYTVHGRTESRRRGKKGDGRFDKGFYRHTGKRIRERPETSL